MRWLLACLVALLLLLQYRLWLAEGGLAERQRLREQVREQTQINAALAERNAVLEREVLELQTGKAGLEQRAREELGLVAEGETYYHVQPQPARVPEARRE
ncbi:MAG: septum formation initiator family protein [Halioglobus sp.]|nr:septum formation initiator family protein [Halioglobus sp.]